jgi:hypothetical protein
MAENVLMMRCTHCGEMNQLPVVHCKKCGAKLDFDRAEKHMIESGEPTLQEQLRLVAKLALAVLLLLIVALLLWPGRMTRTTGEELDAKRYRLKGELLIDALNRGMPASQVIQELEINAHFREVLANQPPTNGGFSPVLEDVGARFFAGRAEVFIAVRRGPLTFTGHFYAKPKDAKLVVTGAKAGHLPLPGFLGKLYAGTVGGVFRQMNNESRIIRNLDGVSVNDGSIELLTKSGN